MITLENISSGEVFEGKDIEYFVDDDTQIGEADLDGDLVFQALDVMNDSQLDHALKIEYKLLKASEDNFSNFND